MGACFNFEDIVKMGTPQIASLTAVGNHFSHYLDPGACDAFSREVYRFEGCVTQLHIAAATMVKQSATLEEVAEIWKQADDFCASAIYAVSALKEKYPHCGTPELYDLLLDHKLATQTRLRNVMEEIECQKTQAPAGLFPAMI